MYAHCQHRVASVRDRIDAIVQFTSRALHIGSGLWFMFGPNFVLWFRLGPGFWLGLGF